MKARDFYKDQKMTNTIPARTRALKYARTCAKAGDRLWCEIWLERAAQEGPVPEGVRHKILQQLEKAEARGDRS